MGKYIKKTKALGGEVTLMEVPHPSSLGVRTRARTLALQRLQNASPAASSSSSYLQLRSRRLHKVAPAPSKPKESTNPSLIPKSSGKARPCLRSGVEASGSASIGSCTQTKRQEAAAAAGSEASPESDAGVEASFGENVLDCEARNRNARETTPCSLIRNSETIETPGSTTRPTSSAIANRRTLNSTSRCIPTAHEMEEFFSGAEQLQQQTFAEKYNYDPVNDRPLPGRYEWVRLDS